MPTTHGAERTEPLSFDAGGTTQERRAGPGEFDEDICGLMMATQDSFRRQLADMRDNLNKVSITCDRLHNRWVTRRARIHHVDNIRYVYTAGLGAASKDVCSAMYCNCM